MCGSNPHRINIWSQCFVYVLRGIKELAKVDASPKRNAQKQGWLAMCTAIQLGNDTQKAVMRLVE